MDTVKSVAPMVGTAFGVVALGYSYTNVNTLTTKTTEIETKTKENTDALLKISTSVDQIKNNIATVTTVQQDVTRMKKTIKNLNVNYAGINDIDELKEFMNGYITHSESHINRLYGIITELTEQLKKNNIAVEIKTVQPQVEQPQPPQMQVQPQQPKRQNVSFYPSWNAQPQQQPKPIRKPTRTQTQSQQDTDSDDD
jgi:chromosome segregation ATPase